MNIHHLNDKLAFVGTRKTNTLCAIRVIQRKEMRRIFKMRAEDDIDVKTGKQHDAEAWVTIYFPQRMFNVDNSKHQPHQGLKEQRKRFLASLGVRKVGCSETYFAGKRYFESLADEQKEICKKLYIEPDEDGLLNCLSEANYITKKQLKSLNAEDIAAALQDETSND